MNSWHSYPKVWAIGHPNVKTIFDDEVLIETKIDGCFSSDTPILLSDGTVKNIGNIVNNKSALEVMSYNEKTKTLEPNIITNWFKYENTKKEDWLKIIVRGKVTSRKSYLKVTKNHKIYTDKGYVLAKNLKIGDILYKSSYKLDYIQKQLVLGSCLGDAYLPESSGHANSRFTVSHKKEHKQYTLLKQKLLKELNPVAHEKISGYGTKMKGFTTCCHPELSILSKLTNKNQKKKVNRKWLDSLDIIGLAFWYMDDGSTNGGQAYFHTQGFSYNEQKLLIKKLSQFGIKANIRDCSRNNRKKMYNIAITQNNIDSFFYLIAQYIPKVMQYKLPEKFRYLNTFWDNYNFDIKRQKLIETKILDIQKIDTTLINRYDIEVKNNHNYFANYILVSNSQFSFGIIDGELKCRSRGQQLVVDAPEKMFELAVQTAKELEPLLHPEWTYRAEYLNKPKHNTLAYDRVPKKYLIIFDVNTGPETYLNYEDKKAEAERLGLEVVPTFGMRKINSPDDVLDLLETICILGGQKIEGIVCKNYKQFGRDGHALLAKYVSEAFKEKHKVNWKTGNPSNGDIIQSIAQSYRTDARWEKAIIHLKERGELTNSPKDIGALMKELHLDLEEECSDEIAAKLLKHALPKIKRTVTSGFPQYYKDKLLKNQFGEEWSEKL